MQRTGPSSVVRSSCDMSLTPLAACRGSLKWLVTTIQAMNNVKNNAGGSFAALNIYSALHGAVDSWLQYDASYFVGQTPPHGRKVVQKHI